MQNQGRSLAAPVVDQIIALRRAGESIRKIAARVGVARSTVEKHTSHLRGFSGASDESTDDDEYAGGDSGKVDHWMV